MQWGVQLRRGEQEGCVCTKEENASRRDLSNVQWDRTGADADADDASGDGIEGTLDSPCTKFNSCKVEIHVQNFTNHIFLPRDQTGHCPARDGMRQGWKWGRMSWLDMVVVGGNKGMDRGMWLWWKWIRFHLVPVFIGPFGNGILNAYNPLKPISLLTF